MMERIKLNLGIALAFVFVLAGCQSRGPCESAPVTEKAPQGEIDQLKQFIESNKIDAKADERGFYYSIQKPGSGAKPTVCSEVSVNYRGELTNGSSFDSGNDVRFGLNQLIVGWQEGIPLIAPGGSITLYLPPSLAYGSMEQPGIPANSILVFKIDLLKAN
ncbi:FKBP-type peptidyl-prolyl cis-trans isomerase [Spirosoma sp. SC4-14]|uniref:FKBP-type peptidyl-prolyl cis-trans isomerase n=1 Tax=Spirosoma sp. SC4-14 TaxID=3128900 RepID=UPI0030D4B3C4